MEKFITEIIDSGGFGAGMIVVGQLVLFMAQLAFFVAGAFAFRKYMDKN